MFDLRPWARSLPDTAERDDVVERLYRAWNRIHPKGTVRGFWLAVSTGDVQVPGAPYLHSQSPRPQSELSEH
jgi:hypothetical protein